MKLLRSVALILALAGGALPQARQTIYVDRMDGLESFVEKALVAADLPFEFIEERSRPELKATLAKKHTAYAEILYRGKLGRNEDHVLELQDVETGKVLATYSFAIKNDDASRTRIAEAFAKQVRKAVAKNAAK